MKLIVDTTRFASDLVAGMDVARDAVFNDLGERGKTLFEQAVAYFTATATDVTIDIKDGVMDVVLDSETAEAASVSVVYLLNFGTAVRRVALTDDFVRSTFPNSLASRNGQGGEIVPLQYGKFDGIEARNWDKLVAAELEAVVVEVILDKYSKMAFR